MEPQSTQPSRHKKLLMPQYNLTRDISLRNARDRDDDSHMDFDECTFQNEAVLVILVILRHAVRKHWNAIMSQTMC